MLTYIRKSQGSVRIVSVNSIPFLLFFYSQMCTDRPIYVSAPCMHFTTVYTVTNAGEAAGVTALSSVKTGINAILKLIAFDMVEACVTRYVHSHITLALHT